MKKTLLITFLAMTLVACGNKTSQDEEKIASALDQKNTEESQDQPSQEDQDTEEEKEDEDKITRTYPDDKDKEVKKEVIDVQNKALESKKQEDKSGKDSSKKDEKSSKKDKEKSPVKDDKKSEDKEKSDKKDKKDKADKKDKSDKKDDKDKEGKTDKADKKDKATKGLTTDDYFFSYYSLVSLKDDQIINVLEDIKDYDENYAADYVPFSDNVFVLGSYDGMDFSIRKINGRDLTLLYDFKDNEAFSPLGMLGDKVYGFYQVYTGKKGYESLDKDTSGLAQVDLSTGKVNLYKASRTVGNETIIGATITDKKAYYTKLEVGSRVNLYELDLEKGFDQEAELVEENTLVSNLATGKHFEKGKPVYKLFKSQGDTYKIKDLEYPQKDNNRVSFIGKYLIEQSPVKFDDDKYLFKMDVIDYLTGKTILKDEESYGFRAANGKLYYIDYDKNIQSINLE